MASEQNVIRCFGGQDQLMCAYHDDEWGVPVHEDRALFEKLMLDAFQAGLSWRTILHKREAFQSAFDQFEPDVVAGYGPDDVARLMGDAGIVRNRAKIEATITNAGACLEIQKSAGSFAGFLWSFTGGRILKGPAVSRWQDKPTQSPESLAMSRALREQGFKFVGATVCYAFMQAVGMIDDHLRSCFKYSGQGP